MLNALKKWWRNEEDCGETPELKLAITKLMVGMMGMNGTKSVEEYNEIILLLEKYFDLTHEEGVSLIEEALDDSSTKLRFDKVVHKVENSFSVEQRCDVLGHLWMIAMADGEISAIEENYINRLAGLLDVPTTMLNKAKAKLEAEKSDLNQSKRYQEHVRS